MEHTFIYTTTINAMPVILLFEQAMAVKKYIVKPLNQPTIPSFTMNSEDGKRWNIADEVPTELKRLEDILSAKINAV